MRTKNWLRINRELHNLTRKELAAETKVSFATIQALEQGINGGTKKTWETLEYYFSQTFNVDIDSIVYDIKNWIKLRNASALVYVSYVITKEDKFIFYDWSFTKPIQGNNFIKIQLGEALKLFKAQNKEV